MLFVSHTDDSFKPFEWISNVLESVLVNFMAVNIDAAYLCRNKQRAIFYVYAASAVAPFKLKANSPEQVEEFVDQFKGLGPSRLPPRVLQQG